MPIRGISLKGKAEAMRDLERFKKAVMLDDKKYIHDLAKFCVDIIKKRTPMSKDIYGKTPKPLKNGKPRTLKNTGSLLDAIRYLVTPNKITIYVNEANKKQVIAEVHNYGLRSGRGKGFKMPKYEFFGFQKIEEELIIKFSAHILNQVMQKYGL